MKSCATCEYFNQTSGAKGIASGECRAHPPLTVPVQVPNLAGKPQLAFTSGWGPVQGEQWCGEYTKAEGSL